MTRPTPKSLFPVDQRPRTSPDRRVRGGSGLRAARRAALVCGALAVLGAYAVPVAAQQAEPRFQWDPNDPRVELGSGWLDAEAAAWNLNHVASLARPEGFFNPETPGDRRFNNTDLAFRGDLLFQGNYNGFQVYDISDPASPELKLSVVCPGGQGDVSVYGDLVFMSA
ncbi:MAG: hypothetical protein HKN73_17165 [Gemmatimonadetes bacterium]|nr:hypothetical protein [Gemmatimonadota bacterium]